MDIRQLILDCREEGDNLFYRNRLYNFISSRVVYHSLFWICAYILLVILEPGHFRWVDTLINEAINLLFYAVIVYINLFYLIPHFLKKKRYLTFFVLLIAVAIFITPIKMFIVVKLSEMLRYMLYECNEKLVSLDKEVNYVKNYLALEQLRHGGKIDIDFALEGEVDGQQIAPLLFVPFLENSFKHGASRTINNGYVKVIMRVKDKSQLQFEVENNKPDTFPMANHQLKSGGIGLANLDRRLNILYPKKHMLTIKDSPNVYRVILDLSL